RPLRVAMPCAGIDLAAFARRVAALGIEAIDDPTVRTPEHMLRRAGTRWELLDRAGHASTFTSENGALHALARIRGSVFVQLPASPELAAQIAGPAVLEVVENAADADYLLAGRFPRNHVQY